MKRSDSPSLGRMVAGGVAALALAMGVGRFAYTPILPSMQLDSGFGDQIAGLIASANYLGYFLGAFAAAAVGRGRPRLIVLRASLIASVATTAVMAATENVLLWNVVRFLSGLASAGILVSVAGIVLDRAVREGREQMSGVLFGGVGLGIAISGLAVLLLDGLVGWRGDWLALAGLSALMAVPAWAWLSEGEQIGAPGSTPHAQAAYRFPLFVLILAYFCEGAGYVVSGTFLVGIVQALPGLSAYGEVAWIVVGLAGVPSCLFWALVAARRGLVGTLIAAHLVQAVGIVLPLVSPSPLAVVAAAILFGGTFMGITTLTVGLAGRIAPANRGRAAGQVTAAFGLGQIVGPLAAGYMAERTGNFDMALIGSAVVVALGALLLFVARAATAPAAPLPSAAEE